MTAGPGPHDFEEFFTTPRPAGVYVQPPGCVFDVPRGDGRARVRVSMGYIVIERIGPDGKIVVAQRFVPEDLDALAEAIKRARCLMLGAPDPKTEMLRAQAVAGLVKPEPVKRRSRKRRS